MYAPVILAPYDPRWPQLFAEEKARLIAAIGRWVEAVEHMGSTAVPGLDAKATIDILVGLRRLEDAAECIAPMAALGYRYLPEYETYIPERRFFRKGTANVYTHHAHLVTVNGGFWERHLLFRDYLRAHPETAADYLRLKRDLAVRFRDDRDAYTDGKTGFVHAVEALARAEREAGRA